MADTTQTDPLNLRGRSVAPLISTTNIDPKEDINGIGAPSSYTTNKGSD